MVLSQFHARAGGRADAEDTELRRLQAEAFRLVAGTKGASRIASGPRASDTGVQACTQRSCSSTSQAARAGAAAERVAATRRARVIRGVRMVPI